MASKPEEKVVESLRIPIEPSVWTAFKNICDAESYRMGGKVAEMIRSWVEDRKNGGK
jgi:hypothetical protein